MDAFGNAAQTFGAVPRRVHASNVGEQSLGGTDIRCGLLATNVLLAGLQRETQCGSASSVSAHSYKASGQCACMNLVRRDERSVWAAEAHRHSKSLSRTDRNVDAELPWGSEQNAGQ